MEIQVKEDLLTRPPLTLMENMTTLADKMDELGALKRTEY